MTGTTLNAIMDSDDRNRAIRNRMRNIINDLKKLQEFVNDVEGTSSHVSFLKAKDTIKEIKLQVFETFVDHE